MKTPKKLSLKNPQTKTKQAPDSIAKACLPFTDLMQGEIVHLSFDCPKSLREAFKSAVRANGSSVCHVLQTFMLTYLVANHYKKACFSNTMRSPIVIKHLEIPTYVKSRVRRVKHELVEVSYGVPSGVCFKCKVEGVRLLRVKFVSDLIADVCEKCFEDYQRRTLVKAVLGEVGGS